MYASLILHAGGVPITEDSISNVLVAAGVEPDQRRIQALVVALANIDVDETIKILPVVAAEPAPIEVIKLEKIEEEINDGGLAGLFKIKPKKEEEEASALSRLFG